MKTKKPRKPRELIFNGFCAAEIGDSMFSNRFIYVPKQGLNSKEARKLAAYLIKAADWLEAIK